MTEVLKKANTWAIAAFALVLTGKPQSAASSVCLTGSVNLADLSGIDERPIGSDRLHEAAVDKEGSVVPEELFAAARLKGSVRVIVQLRIAPAVGESREHAVATARNALLGELAGLPHSVLRSYDSIPAVALEVGVDGLNVLGASSKVAQVTEDKPRRPFQGKSGPAPLHRAAESMA